MSDFQDVLCPSCEKPHLVDMDEVPLEGAFRACPHCGASMRVARDGSPARVAPAGGIPLRPVAVADEEPSELAVFLKTPLGSVERVSHHAVEQGIQMRRVLPWDLVSEDGRDFEQASEHPELRRFFFPADFTLQVQVRCANHPDAFPAATCRRCGRSYCSSCAGSLFRAQPRLCPACGGPVAEPDPRIREIPPWQRLAEVIRFPIDQNGWIATLLVGAILWIAAYGSPATLPLNLLAIPILLAAVVRSAKGAVLPNPELGQLLRESLPIALVSAVIAVPFLLLWFLDPGIGFLVQFPLTLALFFYYPMAVALLLVAEEKDRAFPPRTVFRAVWALRDEYFVYVALFIGVAVALVAILLVVSFLPWIAGILRPFAFGYAWMIQAHLLGFFIYMNRERLRAAV